MYNIEKVNDSNYIFTVKDPEFFRGVDETLENLFPISKDRFNILTNIDLIRPIYNRLIVSHFVKDIKIEVNKKYIIKVILPDDVYYLSLIEKDPDSDNILSGIVYGPVLRHDF